MITLKQISLRRGTKLLLDQASVTLNPGEKVGLVGRNGAGNRVCLRCSTAACKKTPVNFTYPRNGEWGKWHKRCQKPRKVPPNL